MTTRTVVTVAKGQHRVTIPIKIVRILNLTNGDTLDWRVITPSTIRLSKMIPSIASTRR